MPLIFFRLFLYLFRCFLSFYFLLHADVSLRCFLPSSLLPYFSPPLSIHAIHYFLFMLYFQMIIYDDIYRHLFLSCRAV